jgi:hypothetical protein
MAEDVKELMRSLLAGAEPRRQPLSREVDVAKVNALKNGLTEVVTHELRSSAPDPDAKVRCQSHPPVEDYAAHAPEKMAVHEFCRSGEDRLHDG